MASRPDIGHQHRMSISSSAVVRSTFAFLLVGLLALLGIVGMIFWLGERAQFFFDQAVAVRDTRTAAVELRSDLQTAESSQRGYMVGGNEIYLAPYDATKAAADRQLANLKRLLAADPAADQRIDRLAGLVAGKFGEMDQTITLKRARHDDEAMAVFRTNKGKALMDEANIFIAAIIDEADDRLIAGVSEQRANAGWLRLVSAIGTLVIFAVVGGSAIVLMRYTRELRRARDELNALNAGLEQRVSERTADLVEARDRAQVLLSEVNHRVANSLAMVSSLITLQSRTIGDAAAKTALTETQERIFAISLVHKRLYGSSDVRVVMLDEYLTALLDHLSTSLRSQAQGISLVYDLTPLGLETDRAVNLGVVVTEWITNAFKYAYPDGLGEVRVRLRQLSPERAEIVVEDDGAGMTEGAAPRGTGLGTRIVAAMSSSLDGEISYLPRQPGTRARLEFSCLPRKAEAAQ
jgi:two-component sensor histidine kinase